MKKTVSTCDSIIHKMKEMSFPQVKKLRRAGSDHYGIKEFPNLQTASQTAIELKDKSLGKVLGVRIIPLDD